MKDATVITKQAEKFILNMYKKKKGLYKRSIWTDVNKLNLVLML